MDGFLYETPMPSHLPLPLAPPLAPAYQNAVSFSLKDYDDSLLNLMNPTHQEAKAKTQAKTQAKT